MLSIVNIFFIPLSLPYQILTYIFHRYSSVRGIIVGNITDSNYKYFRLVIAEGKYIVFRIAKINVYVYIIVNG